MGIKVRHLIVLGLASGIASTTIMCYFLYSILFLGAPYFILKESNILIASIELTVAAFTLIIQFWLILIYVIKTTKQIKKQKCQKK